MSKKEKHNFYNSELNNDVKGHRRVFLTKHPPPFSLRIRRAKNGKDAYDHHVC